jgi:type I restriction enzyme S subunit
MKQGWEIKKLGDVCIFKSGTTISTSLEREIGDVLYVKVGDMNLSENEIEINTSSRFVNSNEIKAIQIIPEGAVIFPKRGGAIATNKKRKVIRPTIVDLNTMAIIPTNKLDNEYFYYWFQMIDLNDISNGTTIPQINNYSFDNVHIAYPKSLPEQQRIVSILDEAFAAIAKAKANAEQNLKNAKELFESYLQGVFENGNWGFVKLSEMATDISDGDHMPPPKSEFGLPFITISNINKQTHKINFSDTFKVPQKYYDGLKPNKKPVNGDVLYTVTGSYGIPVLIEDDFKFCFQRHIGLIRPSKKLNSKLLYYWILSPQAFLQANETATGTAQKTVSLKSLRNFSFPNIPINEQQTIVRQLDALRAETQKLETIYQQKLLNLEELKKSVLQKAFAGELKTENVGAV